VLISQGFSIAETSRTLGIDDHTYYRWRIECGGTRVDQAKLLKELEVENTRLKSLVADVTPDKGILKEAAPGKLLSPHKRRQAVIRACKRLCTGG
jgi:putative transposase